MMLTRLYTLCLFTATLLMSTTAYAQDDACFLTSGDTAGFHLSVETYANDGIPGMTTYRVYMNTSLATDFVSAVIGDAATPAFLRSTTSFYQEGSFGGATPNGINSSLFSLFPDLAYDSWVTIGIDSQTDLAAGQTDVATLVDPNIGSWVTSFADGGDIEMNTTVGGGWYILPTSANGIAGSELKVLIAQLTTDGDISGQLHIQTFPNGSQVDKIDHSYAFSTVDCPCADTDNDGVCDTDEIAGCLDSAACNYDAFATDDDGSCSVLDECNVCGGSGIPASDCDCNGNQLDVLGVCGGPCMADLDADGVCDVDETYGCTDSASCNYEASATEDNGTCATCCIPTSASLPGYGMDVDIVAVHTEGALAGQTTYRLYVTTPSAGDLVTAVAGGDGTGATIINTTSSFYQDALGGNFASGSNPLLYSNFPDLEYDSWLTIGIDQTPDAASNETEIQYVESESWTAEFAAGESFAINGFYGGAWFVTNNYSNGISGAGQRVLLAQLTTGGHITGQMLVQVVPENETEFELVTISFEPLSDPSAPIFTYVPEDVTLECGDAIPDDMATAEQACSVVSVTMTTSNAGDACNELMVQTFTATDAYGMTSSATRTITFVDSTDPVFDVPVNVTINCGDSTDPSHTGDVTSWTDCSADVTVEHSDAAGWENDDCTASVVVRTWTLTDACGNGFNKIQLITVMDAAAPVFTDVPANVTLECGDALPTSDATASDDCGSISMSQSDATTSGDCAGESFVTRTFTATDDCGNSAIATQVFHYIDTQAPAFTDVPADVTIYVDGTVPTDMATASDDCSTVNVTSADASNSDNTQTLITRTFTASDDCGNSATAVQTITVLEYMGCMDSAGCNYDPVATSDDGSCEYCSCSGIAPTFSNISLEIDTVAYHTEGDLAGQTTYRLYVSTPSNMDFLSSVTGDASNPTRIQTTTNFYHHILGSSSAQGINPMLLIPFPELVYDSWVTVGLQNQANSALGEVDVSLIEGEPWIAGFDAGGDIMIDGAVGGGWYTLNGASNGVSGYDQRVLVGQFTTDGTLYGELFVQLFPEGDGDNMIFETLHFGTLGCGCSDVAACNFNPDAENLDASLCLYPEDYYGVNNLDCDGACLNDSDGDSVCDEDEVPGCTDVAGCNYSNLATDDDGTCQYPPAPYDCFGNCANDADNDGICDEYEVQGCTFDSACNYDAAATENDGNCDFDSCRGCTDAGAFNYDANATIDDGSCLFAGCTDAAASNYDNTADFNDGSCSYPGCTNAQACNFDPAANIDDDSCDTTSCAGCTNSIACNYDVDASMNDGSCEFFSCRGCIDSQAFNYDASATMDDGTCIYGGCTDSAAMNYDGTVDFNNGSCQYGGCIDNTACNFDATANTDDGSCDFTSCAGCMITFACNYDPTATIQDDSACDFYSCCGDATANNYTPGTPSFLTVGCTYDGTPPSINFTDCELEFACNFGSTDPCEFSSCAGCTTPGSCNYDVTATIPLTCLSAEDLYGVTYLDCDGNCLNDVNTNGQCDETETSGCTNPLACNYTDGATLDDASCDLTSCLGCTDALACNYDAAASINDNSCDYSSCFGCTDALACNYDDSATSSDGSCTYPASVNVNCAGDCFNDVNTNGLCDETETTGCTAPSACNFNLVATFDDESCEYTSCAGCTDTVACNYDSSASLNTGCEYTSCAGCTDATACNYDAAATLDDSGCAFPVTYYNCAGECLGDADGDGVCDGADATYDGCNDALACNFNPAADTDDGSCDFCSCAGTTSSDGNYGLVIEEHAVDGIPGYVTYRVYVTLPNATDKVSAVTGVSQNPTFINTTGDFYQDILGSAFPNSVNPLLYDNFPGLEYDSWFTIGIDQSPDMALGQGAIQGLPEPEPWTSVFEAGNGFAIDDVIGSGWFVNPDVTNGVAGADNRVLLAQLTTNGVISGQFYVQIFPEGDNLNQQRVTLGMGSSQCGCTEADACNYAPGAMFDDGSCFYSEFGYDCDDDCLFDSEAPTFDGVVEDVTVSCGTLLDFAPTASDNCDTNLEIVATDDTTFGACVGSYQILRTYVAIDDFGYQSQSLSHVITIVDDTAPVLSNVPASTVLTCGESLPTSMPTATDECSGVTLTVADVWAPGACDGFGIWTRTFTATDGCGNEAAAIATFTVSDDIAPAITNVPADVALACGESYDFPVPSATDACSAVNYTETLDTLVGVCANDLTITRTFFFTDLCANQSSAVQIITVSDVEAPVLFGVPADLTLSCGDDIPTATVTAADGCGGDVSIVLTEVATAVVNCTYDLIQTYTATDLCGNQAVSTRTVTFIDDVAPTFTVPADATIDCSTSTDPASTGEVLDASDACTADPSVSYSDVVSNGSFSLDGLTADLRVDLTVANLMNFPRTLEATGVSLGAGIELTTADEISNPFQFQGALEVDVDGGQILLSVADVLETQNFDFVQVALSNVMANPGIVGAILTSDNLLSDPSQAEASVEWTGNSVTITWTEVPGGDMRLIAGGTATVDLSGASNCIAQNIIDRTWTVTDGCGNASSAVQTITMADMTAPEFGMVPADLTLDCGDSYDIVMASASDACSGVTVTVDETHSYPCEGTDVMTLTFTAIDGCGNSATEVQTVTFEDTTPPVFVSTPLDVVLSCTEALPSSAVEVSDNCGIAAVEQADVMLPGDCAGSYQIERTFTATDGCGNSSTHVQTFIFTDNEAPAVTNAPADTTVTMEVGMPMYLELPTVEDACGSASISYSDLCSNVAPGGYETTRVFTITDDCGNSVELLQQITVVFAGGCTNASATNYDVDAMIDDGSCTFGGCTNLEAVNYNPLADVDDGSCIVTTIEGCMDAAACNFHPAANTEDGSCDFCSCADALEVDGYSLDMETYAVDGIPGMTTYRLYVTMANADDFLSSVAGETGFETAIRTSTTFYQDVLGGALGQNTQSALFSIQPTLAYDSYVTIGLTETADLAGGEGAVTTAESDPWVAPFEGGADLVIGGDFGGAWFVLDGSSNGVAGNDMRVLIGQFTTSGSLSGQVSFQVFPHGNGAAAELYTIAFGNPDCGCADATACNFDGYTEEDGSCLFPDVYECDGMTCVNDTDDDGVCDELEVAGCSDAAAINYDAAATDDDGSCLLAGCTDPTALNFDPTANFNTGCILPLEGCTDPAAYNYNELANTNDGSCEYDSPCPGDLNGDGEININDLLDFFQLYGSDCPE